MSRELGSPLLIDAGPDEYGEPERFADADALARRVHDLRRGAALDVTVGSCATADGIWPGVLIWTAARPGRPKAYLAFAAGPGVDTPDLLLAALGRTRTPAAKAA